MTRDALSQRLQRYWWLVSLLTGAVTATGATYVLPGERLARIEATDVRQDSAAAQLRRDLHVYIRSNQSALERIERSVQALQAGTCIKERDRMARVVYGCS